MSAENPLIVYYNNHEIEVEDPTSEEAFLEAFKDVIEEFASENYACAFESEDKHYEIDKEYQRKFADAANAAIKDFRENAERAPDDERRHDIEWGAFLHGAIYRELYGEQGHHNAQEDAQDNLGFIQIYQAIEEAMSEYDGPVCDLDSLWSEMSVQTTQRMEELDTSTLYDTYGKASIKFVYLPGFDPERAYLDDHTLYINNLQDLDPDSRGFDVMLKLFKIDPLALMEALNIDHEDTKLINKWINSVPQSDDAPVPVITIDQVIEIFENAGTRYGFPCWMGELSLNEFQKLDPLKPLVLSGGSIGLNNTGSGCGYMIDLPKETTFTLEPNDSLLSEWGAEMEASAATITNPIEVKPKPKLELGLEL
jgi:hypothetical protein